MRHPTVVAALSVAPTAKSTPSIAPRLVRATSRSRGEGIAFPGGSSVGARSFGSTARHLLRTTAPFKSGAAESRGIFLTGAARRRCVCTVGPSSTGSSTGVNARSAARVVVSSVGVGDCWLFAPAQRYRSLRDQHRRFHAPVTSRPLAFNTIAQENTDV